MVFKKPGNSRDDKSSKSSGRRAAGGDSRSNSSPRTRNTASSFNKSDSAPQRRGTGEGQASNDKKPFSSFRKTSSGSFSGDRPKRSFGGNADSDKKPFSPRGGRKPGEGFGSDDRPKRNYGNGPANDRKPFSPKGRPATEGRTEGSREQSDYKPRTNAAGIGGEKRYNKPAGTGRTTNYKTSGGFNRRPVGGNNEPAKIHPTRDDNAAGVPGERTESAPKVGRGRKKPAESDSHLIRLNRYIANAGICSRRKADELIAAGVVSVNGEVVSELGHKVDPAKDVVRYNGETLKREKMVYVLLNKPKDYITTTEDPQERRTVMHLIESASRERLYPVGRLDRNTTGLLLMTNDGELTDKLSHPRTGVTKIYHVELDKSLTQGDLNKIQFGVELEDGLMKPDNISYVQGGSKREIGIQIHSGKNRIVRRLFEHLGYEVVKLDRTIYANLTKKDLPRGRWRYLEEQEIIQLKHLIK